VTLVDAARASDDPEAGVDGRHVRPGLREVVAGTVELGDVVTRGGGGVWHLPAGAPDQTLLGRERRLAAVLGATERTGSVVVVAAPGTTEDEWPVVAPLGDHTVLVIEWGRARRSTLRELAASAALGPGATSVVLVDGSDTTSRMAGRRIGRRWSPSPPSTRQDVAS